MEYNFCLSKTGRNACWSLKPVHDILANISDDKELVKYIISECQTEIIKRYPFITQIIPLEWTILYITFLATIPIFNIINYFIQLPNKQRKQKAILTSTKQIESYKISILNLWPNSKNQQSSHKLNKYSRRIIIDLNKNLINPITK